METKLSLYRANNRTRPGTKNSCRKLRNHTIFAEPSYITAIDCTLGISGIFFSQLFKRNTCLKLFGNKHSELANFLNILAACRIES